jgi:nicotinamide-nucleotide amidase
MAVFRRLAQAKEDSLPETLSPALPADIDTLVEQVLKAAHDAGLKLATAESCTGGLLASLLTDVDGFGHAFERGFVVYTVEAKHELLGVAETLLADPGPVSEVVARAMAEGAIANSKADVAVSITGFAGEGAPEDPAGLVHFGVARRGGSTWHEVHRFPVRDRAGVRLMSLRVALRMLHERIV